MNYQEAAENLDNAIRDYLAAWVHESDDARKACEAGILIISSTARDIAEEMLDEQSVECLYCGQMVKLEDSGEVPAQSDDEAWERIAANHAPDCEWVTSRAHRRES